MEGFLKLNVLHELNSESLSGYELIKRISLSQQKRPSPGSIYPLLNELLFKGFVNVKEEGRKKIYSITSKGTNRISSLVKEKEKMFEKHFILIKEVSDIMGQDDIKKLERILELKKKEGFIPYNMDVFLDIITLSAEIASGKDRQKKQKQIRKILTNTLKELDKLR